jgi:hypothetical protein
LTRSGGTDPIRGSGQVQCGQQPSGYVQCEVGSISNAGLVRFSLVWTFGPYGVDLNLRQVLFRYEGCGCNSEGFRRSADGSGC